MFPSQRIGLGRGAPVCYCQQRIEQAIRRAGLGDLLGPALDDVKRICKAVTEAKSQIGDATVKLMEK